MDMNICTEQFSILELIVGYIGVIGTLILGTFLGNVIYLKCFGKYENK